LQQVCVWNSLFDLFSLIVGDSSLRTIIAKIKEEQSADRAVVLATLVDTKGSTYRRPGARMIITESGQFHGLVSGGCLEGDLVLHAKKVFFDQRSSIVEYDMRAEEEGAWGLALGCNGLVRIHLQYLASTESDSQVLMACEYADKRHQPVLLLSDLSEKAAGAAPTALFADGNYISEQIQESNLGLNWQSIKEDTHVRATEFASDQGITYLAEWIVPQFHLLILGAGPDTAPVCSIAKLAGWYITLVDHRVAYVNKAKILDANRVVRSEPKKLSEKIDLASVDAVLLMSHHLDADTEYFSSLMGSSVPYIGMLGPKDRSEIILSRQGKIDKKVIDRVHAPVGLDIGGEGPEAIALSIVAEIQTQANNCSAKPLREKDGGIHD